MSRTIASLIFSATFVVAPLSFSATIIDTTPGNSTVTAFGESNSATFGQTVTVPAVDNVLTSFTFFMDDFLDTDFVDFEAYVYQPVEKCHRGIFQPRQVRNEVPHGSQNNDLRRHFAITSVCCNSPLIKSTGCYAWDGSKATGAMLFSAGPFSTTNNGGSDGFETFTINTGNLALTPGGSHVLFFSASNQFDGVVGKSFWPFRDDNPYSGGHFVFFSNANNFNLLTTNTWGSSAPDDLAFQATFVPEPSTLALAAYGWRRKR